MRSHARCHGYAKVRPFPLIPFLTQPQLENLVPSAGTNQTIPAAETLEAAGAFEAEAEDSQSEVPLPFSLPEPTINGKRIAISSGALDHPGHLRTQNTVSRLWKKTQGKTKKYEVVAVSTRQIKADISCASRLSTMRRSRPSTTAAQSQALMAVRWTGRARKGGDALLALQCT